MTIEGLLAAIEAALGALHGVGVDYALVGGAALPAWGRMRATHDADLLLALSPLAEEGKRTLEGIVGALRDAGFAHLERADRQRLEDKLILHFWFPLRPLGLSVRVDLILMPGPAGEEIVRRAARRRINGIEARVASCEDIILLELAAKRPIDAADVEDLIAVNRGGIDWNYLEEGAARMGLARDLEEARGRARA